MFFQHWFWDFDGTLYDTYPLVVEDFAKALQDAGLFADESRLLAQVKITLYGAARTYAKGDEVLAESLLDRYQHYAGMRTNEELRPYPLAGEMLRAVTQRGGRNYLYTHRDLSAVEALKHDHLWTAFSGQVTKEDGFPHKPRPDALLHLLDTHGLDPAECCMVGDRDIDLDAAKNAGITPVLFDPDHFYDHYDTPYRFSSYQDMLQALDAPKGGKHDI